jgi:hypothetical protein
MTLGFRPGFRRTAGFPPAPTSGFRFFWTLALTLLLGVWAVAPALARPAATPTTADLAAVERATTALVSMQDPSGGFPGFSGEVDPAASLDALLALAAARDAGIAVDLDALLAYVATEALVIAQTGPAAAARLTLALAAAGENPRSFASVDAVSIVAAGFDDATGFCGSQVYEHSLCVVALVAAGDEAPAAWIESLRANQNDDGGWAYDGSAASRLSDSNTTALAIQALVAAGVAPDDPALAAGRAFLESLAVAGGGVAYMAGEPLVADANSTALGIQAMLALGETTDDVAAHVAALVALQNDSGLFGYSADYPDDNLLATVQAIPALLGRVYPWTPTR